MIYLILPPIGSLGKASPHCSSLCCNTVHTLDHSYIIALTSTQLALHIEDAIRLWAFIFIALAVVGLAS